MHESSLLGGGCGRNRRCTQGDTLTVDEWLVYAERRDERDAHKGLCSIAGCGVAAVVIGYSGMEHGADESVPPTFACEGHALEQGWTGTALVLGEGEIALLCQMSGEPSSYYEPYESMVNGRHVVFWTNLSEEYPEMSPLRAFRVHITAMAHAQKINSGETEMLPSARLFEGIIERSTDSNVVVGDKCTGIIFPNDNFATIFPYDPAGDYADRSIAASLVMTNHGVD